MGNFEATGPTMVPVRQGDMIEVLETHHTGWSYAKNLSHSFLVICCEVFFVSENPCFVLN